MFCKNCGNELDDDAIFCTKCGTNKNSTDNVFYCENCGANYSEGSAFCTSCGKEKAAITENNHKEVADEQVKTIFNPETKKKKTKKLCIFSLLSLVLFIGGIAISFSDESLYAYGILLFVIIIHGVATVFLYLSLLKERLWIKFVSCSVLLCCGIIFSILGYDNTIGDMKEMPVSIICLCLFGAGLITCLLSIIYSFTRDIYSKENAKNVTTKSTVVIFAVSILSGGYFGNIYLYQKRAYPVYEAAKERFSKAVDDYNRSKNSLSAENADRYALDCMESYLDYYKGKTNVAFLGIGGNFPGMNKWMEDIISLFEENHLIGVNGKYISPKAQEYYDKRMSELRAEWRRVKRQ